MKEQLHADSGDVRYQSTQESNASEIQYYLVVKYNRYKTLSTLFSHKMNLYFGLCPDQKIGERLTTSRNLIQHLLYGYKSSTICGLDEVKTFFFKQILCKP